MNDSSVDLREDLVRKYDFRSSFYTDYPPLGLWLNSFSDKDYIKALEDFISKKEKSSLLLYVHFPFCPKR